MRQLNKTIFYLYGDGHCFDQSPSKIINEIVFSGEEKLLGQRNWFIHDGYEVRYYDFMRLALQIMKESVATPDARSRLMVKAWEKEGLSLSEPFTEEDLKSACQFLHSSVYNI